MPAYQRFAATLAASIFTLACHASPHGTLTFIEPDGMAATDEVIEVWMRLTLDSDSSALVLDPEANLFGVDPTDIPAGWASLTNAYLNVSFDCGDGFTSDCAGEPYIFELNLPFESDSVVYLNQTALSPGDSLDFRLGNFIPSLVSVPAGIYEYSASTLYLWLDGLDTNGNDVSTTIIIAETTDCGYPECAFSRLVTPIPEPSSFNMMLAALGLLALRALRDSSTR